MNSTIEGEKKMREAEGLLWQAHSMLTDIDPQAAIQCQMQALDLAHIAAGLSADREQADPREAMIDELTRQLKAICVQITQSHMIVPPNVVAIISRANSHQEARQ